MHPRRYLFYVCQNYAFEILRPLQQEILNQGHQVKWFATGTEINTQNFTSQEQVLATISAAIDYKPHACFVPGNDIPNFIPGLKVQVFHGLEWKKKGHFIIRGYFDLYCTHGIATTNKFKQLAKNYGYFDVCETGWPKLDPLFTTLPLDNISTKSPIIVYAPTFSPSLTSAPALFATIRHLIKTKPWYWIFKFHPKMDKKWQTQYQSLTCNNAQYITSPDIAKVLQTADIMVSDTSSVIGEFALLNKPIVTLNNSAPGDYLLDITQAEQLELAIEQALAPNEKQILAIQNYAKELHPYNDGESSKRILDAVENILINGKKARKKLPLNLFRQLKIRKKLNYWKF